MSDAANRRLIILLMTALVVLAACGFATANFLIAGAGIGGAALIRMVWTKGGFFEDAGDN